MLVWVGVFKKHPEAPSKLLQDKQHDGDNPLGENCCYIAVASGAHSSSSSSSSSGHTGEGGKAPIPFVLQYNTEVCHKYRLQRPRKNSNQTFIGREKTYQKQRSLSLSLALPGSAKICHPLSNKTVSIPSNLVEKRCAFVWVVLGFQFLPGGLFTRGWGSNDVIVLFHQKICRVLSGYRTTHISTMLKSQRSLSYTTQNINTPPGNVLINFINIIPVVHDTIYTWYLYVLVYEHIPAVCE